MAAIKDKAGLFGCHLSPPLKTRTRKIDSSQLAICHLFVVIRQIILDILHFCATSNKPPFNDPTVHLLADISWIFYNAANSSTFFGVKSYHQTLSHCLLDIIYQVNESGNQTELVLAWRWQVHVLVPKVLTCCRLHDWLDGTPYTCGCLRWLSHHSNRTTTAGMSKGHNFKVLKSLAHSLFIGSKGQHNVARKLLKFCKMTGF